MKHPIFAEPSGHPIASDAAILSTDSPASTDVAPDPFNPEALRLGQDFTAMVGVRKVVTTVPCRKPGRQEFFRVRPGEEWQLSTRLLEDKINRDIYLVDRALWPELDSETYPARIFLAISRQGNVFLWPCKLPGADGRSNPWNESALAAEQIAEKRWVRLSANMPAGMYDTLEATGNLSEPEWPELSFRDILQLSFKDRFIQSPEHPVLRALRGEV